MSDAKTPASGRLCFKFETSRHLVPAPSGEGRTEIAWSRLPEKLVLEKPCVHLWRGWLDQPEARVAQFERTLSPDERLRAQRFQFDRDRNRFIVGRGMLRATLARYLGVPPTRIALAYGAHGKPRLAAPFDWSRLRFNVSHSEGLALCAVALEREVGVDLERARPIREMAQVATQVFSEREQARLRCVSNDNPVTAFFRFWTSKEALLKARGDGFSGSVKQVETSPAGRDQHHGVEWTSCELLPHPGFIAALVVEGRDWQLRCWDYSFEGAGPPAGMDFPALRKRNILDRELPLGSPAGPVG